MDFFQTGYDDGQVKTLHFDISLNEFDLYGMSQG